jgi:MbtH protein
VSIDSEETGFQVVVNDEEQHSIWFSDRALPDGWRAVGREGTKQECLDYIEQAWPDITPLSVRRRLAAARDAG